MTLAFGCIKLSIIVFYRSLFVVYKSTFFEYLDVRIIFNMRNRSTFDHLSNILGILTFIWTIAFTLAGIFQCGTHFTANWGPLDDVEKYCQSGYSSTYGSVISDVIIDVFILILPIPSVGSRF